MSVFGLSLSLRGFTDGGSGRTFLITTNSQENDKDTERESANRKKTKKKTCSHNKVTLLVIRQKPVESSEVNALSITQPIKEQVGIVC